MILERYVIKNAEGHFWGGFDFSNWKKEKGNSFASLRDAELTADTIASTGIPCHVETITLDTATLPDTKLEGCRVLHKFGYNLKEAVAIYDKEKAQRVVTEPITNKDDHFYMNQ